MKLPKLNNGDPLIATAGAERSVHVLDVDRCSVVKRWPSAMKFDITRLSLSKSSPDHVYVAGLDNELLCGCWSRGALAGGFAFRGDSRWLGMDSTSGGGGGRFSPGEKRARVSWSVVIRVKTNGTSSPGGARAGTCSRRGWRGCATEPRRRSLKRKKEGERNSVRVGSNLRPKPLNPKHSPTPP